MSVTELKTEEKPAAAPTPRPAPSTALALQEDIYESEAAFVHAQRVSASLGASSLVPDSLRKNPADVLTALGLARAMKCHPLLVMQSIFFVGGKAGWESKFMIARANQSGAFRGRIRWKKEGKGTDNLSVTAYAEDAQTGEIVDATCDMDMARAEGWVKNAKYKSMPEHMLKWRSAAFLIRLSCPEVMFGLPIADELEDMGNMRDVSPVRQIAAEALGLHKPPARSDFIKPAQTAEEAAATFDESATLAEQHEREKADAETEALIDEGTSAEADAEAARVASEHCDRMIAEFADLHTGVSVSQYAKLVAADVAMLPEAERQRFTTAKVAREAAIAKALKR